MRPESDYFDDSNVTRVSALFLECSLAHSWLLLQKLRCQMEKVCLSLLKSSLASPLSGIAGVECLRGRHIRADELLCHQEHTFTRSQHSERASKLLIKSCHDFCNWLNPPALALPIPALLERQPSRSLRILREGKHGSVHSAHAPGCTHS